MPTFNLSNGNDTFPGGQPGWINTGEDIVNGFDGEDTIDGGVLNDALSGMNGNDIILGGSGDDVIQGGADDDHLSGGADNDSIAGEAGTDLIHGDAGNDTLKGGSGNDEIHGDAGNDTFDVAGDVVGATDIDVLYGGEGDDKLVTGLIAGTAATISFDGGNGTDTVGAFGSLIGYTFTNVETLDNLYLIRATTSQLNQFAAVEDHYAFDDFTTIFVEDAGIVDFRGRLGTGVIKLNVQSMGHANIIHSGDGDDNIQVHFTATGTGGMVFFGDGGNDDLRGGVGNDIIVGGAGNDYLDGGGGSFNLVSYEDATSAVTVNLGIGVAQDTGGSGIDTIGITSISGIIGSAFGDVLTSQSGLFDTGKTLRGEAGDDVLNGGIWHDTLEGGGDNDVIAGGAGTDTIDGGSGIDTASYAGAAGAVTVSLLAAGPQNVGGGEGFDTLVEIENLIGGSGNDTFTGNAANNKLTGNAGADVLRGGLGDDTYVIDSNADATIEAAAAGTDTTYAGFTHTLRANIENLVLTGGANINGSGNGLANAIAGNSGANILNGLAGGDAMTGLGGNDTYYVDNVLDTASEAGGGGIDTVRSTVNFTLAANIEKLYLTGAAAIGTGNALSNYLYGSAAANTLNGLGGADRCLGGDGNDIYLVDSAGDLVFETNALAAGGVDQVRSSVNYTLGANVERLLLTGGVSINGTGNSLVNVIAGNTGNNFIDGKLGSDTLTGGLGIDQFLFTTALGAANIDTITDFSAPNDTIRLDDAVFASLALGYLAAAAFVTGAAAADASDRIVYNSATGALLFDADGTGAGAAKQFATLSLGLALTAGDFYVF